MPNRRIVAKELGELLKVLSHPDRIQIVQLLAARGFLRGEADGILGSQTRAAVRAYQRANGMAVDGYPSVVVLRHLQRGG